MKRNISHKPRPLSERARKVNEKNVKSGKEGNAPKRERMGAKGKKKQRNKRKGERKRKKKRKNII